MASFDPETYLSQTPDQVADQFLTLKKNELLILGDHFELELEAAMRKAEIQRDVLQCLISEDIIEEFAVELPSVQPAYALEMRKLEPQHELELKKLEIEQEQSKLVHAERIAGMQYEAGRFVQSQFNVSQWFQAVPKFKENAVEEFSVSSEKMADRLKWSAQYFTTLLRHVLVGRSTEVYDQLGVSESADYQFVKQAILHAYQRVPEAYGQKFRNHTKAPS